MSTNHLPSQRRIIRRQVLLGFAFVIAMLGVIAFIAWKSTRVFQEAAEQVAASREMLEGGERLMRHVAEMESARRGFLLVGDEPARRDYDQARTRVFDSLDDLWRATADAPAQHVRLDQLKMLVHRLSALHGEEMNARQVGGTKVAAALLAQAKTDETMREVQDVVFDFAHFERVRLVESSESTEVIARAATVVTFTGTALTFLALSGAGFFILRDLGRRQRAETALAEQANLLTSIMDAMPELVYVKDAETRYIMHNRAHRVYLALRAEESIEGRTAFDLFPKELAERYHADDAYVLETGAPIRDREEPARPASPNIVWLSTTKMPLRAPSGRVIGVVCVSSDITARKEADEKLKRFAEQLERSNAELNSFASVASHDLQEPLRKIQAFGDRLQAKCAAELGEQGRDYLRRMQSAAERMQVLIQDLLKLSRIASRAQPFEPCALTRIVSDVLTDLEIAIEDRQAQVKVDELPVINADPLQMRQLFQNLIANALKFQKIGEPPVIAITSEIVIAAGGEIPGGPRGSELCRLRVQDQGIGFDPKFADQIFVVFQRLHTRHEYEGTGIGLAVCRKITDRHGGTIVAESAEGQGATFVVTLPVKQPTPPHERRHDLDGG